jgi:hypothetical protein
LGLSRSGKPLIEPVEIQKAGDRACRDPLIELVEIRGFGFDRLNRRPVR